MKTLNTILTVLFWAALVIGLLPTIKGFDVLNHLPSNTSGSAVAAIITGNLVAYATVPGIIWVIRYFVRKNINESQNADTGTK